MTAAAVLNVLCAGAAQGLVKALQQRFAAATGAQVQGRFGAVGAMKEALLAGEPCDVMIVTDAMIETLAASGALRGESCAPLGRVRTGIAVRVADPLPAIDTPDELRSALLAADRIYFPDPERATAGIHFAAVLRQLGIDDELAPRFATFSNGATSMRELAQSAAQRPIGCTQVTEINGTDGVRLVGALPKAFELATAYSAAVASRASDPALAARFVSLLAGIDSMALRRQGGFEFGAAAH